MVKATKDNRVSRVLIAFAILASFMLTEPKGYSQFTGSGVIQGTVTDASGAAVPNATVTALNVATGVKFTRTTTNAGFYVASPIPPGQLYTVTVSANGFKTAVQEHVTVNTLSVVELDFTLQVGAVSQQVTVTGAPSALQTTNASLGGTITNEVYSSLPLNMGNLSQPGAQGPRNPEGFIYLMPGVSNATGFAGNINGGETLGKEIYVNGLPFNTAEVQGENRTLTTGVAVDSVDQFKIITNGSPAQYDGQGVENFVIKSGSNKFHGSAYDYVRNTVFDSRGFFASKTPVEAQNEFGGTFGGPIKKDKAFIFGNYDGYRLRFGTSPTFNSIPTAAERNGDFSALPVPIYDPATTVCSGNVCTRQPFPGNVIPQSRFSSISKQFESFLPNPINSSLQNNFLGQYQNGSYNNDYSIRADVNISDKQRIFAWHEQGFSGTIGFPQLPGNTLPLPYAASRPSHTEADAEQLSDTYIFSPTVLNQASLNFVRFAQYFQNFTNGQNYPQKAGLTGLPPGATMFPEIDFGGPNSPTGWADFTGAPFYYNSDNWTFQDNVEWVHGSHNLSFGTQIIWREENQNQGDFFSTFNFSNLATAGFGPTVGILPNTGNAYASFLLGNVNGGSAQWNTAGVVGQRYRNYAGYVQDDWKATPRLTLNLGLRYEVPTPYYEAFNRGSFLNPTLPNPAAGGYPGALQFLGYGPDSCLCRTPVSTHYTDFAPRLGLAYKLNDKTVFRAGYGIYYIMAGSLGGASQGVPLLGYSANPAFATPDGGITPAFNWNSGFPSFQAPPFFSSTLNTGFTTTAPGSQGGVTYLDPQLGGKAPYYQDWNATVEREISPSTTVTVAYAGGAGHFLPTGVGRGIYSNQILPQYLTLGKLLDAPATSANIAAAQAIFPGVHLPYANFAGSIGQMLLPFPQYGGIGDTISDIGNSTYNSLQLEAQRRFASGLQFLISYTWEKTIDDAGSNLGGFLGASGRTAYNNKLEKAVGVQDIPSTLVTSFVYQLPFGSGHALGGRNSLVRNVVSNWQVSGILTYESGAPMGPISGSGFAPFTGGTYANFAPGFSGPARINGSWGSGNNVLGPDPTSYINLNAFSNPVPFTFGDTPRTLPYDLRNPPLYDEDLAVRREFRIKENLRFQFEVDAFNVLNRVVFGSIGTNITSANFGRVGSQVNTPRQLEFVGKFIF